MGATSSGGTRILFKRGDDLDILHQIVGGGANPAIAKARKSLWAFEQYRNPKFFRDDRPHLKELADTLEALYERRLINPATGAPYRKLMINIGPRTGKSYTMSMFNQWAFGRNQAERIISVSYNEMLSTRFAKGVRDGISETKIDPNVPIYSDVFPNVKIKYGDAASQLWALEGSYFSFLAAGFGGTITGVGCSVGIIDDPVKSHIEAANEQALGDQWSWYRDTFLSRVEEGGIQIIVMTRWSTRDLCGQLLESEPGEWYVVKKPACLNEETHDMLCPSLLSWERYAHLSELTSPEIMRANYQQEPIDVAGRLYGEMKTYMDIPRGSDRRALFEKIISYTDTADTGADFLCTIVAGLYQGQLYVLDVQYTDRGMEFTEPETADMLYRSGVQEAYIESNNGGRGFARNVERLLWERHHWRGCKIVPRNQRQNKEARIIVGAAWVLSNVFWPVGWERLFSKFHRDLMDYQRKGRNAHDDAPDCLTGLCEMVEGGGGGRTKFFSGKGRRDR